MVIDQHFDVVIPAAGRLTGEWAAAAGTDVKALLRIGGVTIIERMVPVLRDSGARRVVIVGPASLAEALPSLAVDAWLAEVGSAPANILVGLDWLREREGDEPVLIATADLPFLSVDAVQGFLSACPSEADLCVPIISRASFRAKFPDTVDDYVHLADGDWTLGCLFRVRPAAISRNRAQLDRVFAARKSKLGMARLLGARFLVKFLLRRLTLAEITAKCESLLGCTGAVVLGCAPELAFDLDTVDEARYAERLFSA